MLYIPFPFKRCSKCGEYKLATTKYYCRHTQIKDGLYPSCRICHGKITQNWKQANKERNDEINRVWHQRNKERRHAAAHIWRINHKEKNRAYHRKYLQRHPEMACQWAKEHPVAHRTAARRYRAHKHSAEGTHNAADVQRQYKAQKGHCYWCDMLVGNTYEVDHVIPLVRGGSNGPENIVIACMPCNRSKGYKLPHEWNKSGKLL